MAKFMVLYNSTSSASDTMANATPEQMNASMAEWISWQDEANKSAKFEFGMPLQAIGKVDPSGVSSSSSTVSGYATAEGDSKENIIELLKSHPHLKRPGASIDVLEVISMPGLNV